MRRRFIFDKELGRCVEIPLDQPERQGGPQILMKHPNIAYQSPITGEAVTTWAKRDYDMKAAGCIDYREAKEMAADARANRNSAMQGLTLKDVERHMR